MAHFNDHTWLELNRVATNGVGSGAECKVRSAPRSKVIGIYVENVGSIIVHGWLNTGDARYWAEFLPWRSCFFRPSFRDNVAVISEAYSRWENAVSCMQFSSAGDKVPSVPTVKVKGREYVVTSAVYSREYREGEAWVMRLRSQAEMDALVEQAGFKKIDQCIDEFGIFTVSVAQKIES